MAEVQVTRYRRLRLPTSGYQLAFKICSIWRKTMQAGVNFVNSAVVVFLD